MGIILLCSPKDYSLFENEFLEMDFDVHESLNHRESLSLIQQECKQSDQPVLVACCRSPKDFKMVFGTKGVAEHAVGVIISDLFENQKVVDELTTTPLPALDIGDFALDLIDKTFDEVVHLEDVIRSELSFEKQHKFVHPRNQRIPRNSNLFRRRVLNRRIMKRWIGPIFGPIFLQPHPPRLFVAPSPIREGKFYYVKSERDLGWGCLKKSCCISCSPSFPAGAGHGKKEDKTLYFFYHFLPRNLTKKNF